MEILSENELPKWLKYPPEYRRLVDDGVIKFTPWYLLNSKLARLRYERLQKRYPSRRLFAFAARFDNDDIACWEEGKGSQIIVIHDGASAERCDRKAYTSFWDWFRAAIEDMIQHEP